MKFGTCYMEQLVYVFTLLYTVYSVQYAHDHCQYGPCTEDSALPYVSFAVCSVQYADDHCAVYSMQMIAVQCTVCT